MSLRSNPGVWQFQGISLSSKESFCKVNNCSLWISLQEFVFFGSGSFSRAGGLSLPTERVPGMTSRSSDYLNLPLAFLSGPWPANIDHISPGRKVVTGLCFSPCFVPLLRQSRLHGNRCSLCVAFALGKSMLSEGFSLLFTPSHLWDPRGRWEQ